MLSEKLQRIMRKRELPIMAGMTEQQAWKAIAIDGRKKRKPRPAISICFTGFTASQSEEMKDRARSAGFGVNTRIVKSTTHLCCGENAGPKKVSDARVQGVALISYSDFLHMTETGEIL